MLPGLAMLAVTVIVTVMTGWIRGVARSLAIPVVSFVVSKGIPACVTLGEEKGRNSDDTSE